MAYKILLHNGGYVLTSCKFDWANEEFDRRLTDIESTVLIWLIDQFLNFFQIEYDDNLPLTLLCPDLSRLSTPPKHSTDHIPSSLVVSSAQSQANSGGGDRVATKQPSLDDFQPYPPFKEETKDERIQSVAMPESRPEFKLIEKYNIVSISGE